MPLPLPLPPPWLLPAALLLGERMARGVFGQDVAQAALVGTFCNWIVPGTPPLIWSLVLQRYLQVGRWVAGFPM